ncbi:MAG: lyase [Chloroflexota bacterium]|nr:lyase [Chloroflexota bacterium]
MRIVLIAIVIFGALLLGAQPPVGAAKTEAGATETPPESCLSLETFAVPAGDHPHDVAPAADGTSVWYTGQGSGVLGLFDPTTGESERIPLGDGSAPHGVIVGPDGAAWVTDGGLNAIVRVDAETLAVATYPLPAASGFANLNTAVFDGDGILWFTGQAGLIGRLDPAAGEVVVWPAPRGRGPYGIAASAGGVSFVSLAGNYLGLIEETAAGIQITELEPPTSDAGPRRVWENSAGMLWISEWNAGQVGRYDPATGEWREWRLPGATPQAYAVYVDERDDVWLSDFSANALVRFDPDTETFASLLLPDPGAAVRQIHGRPGEVWGAESAVDKLVVVRTAC